MSEGTSRRINMVIDIKRVTELETNQNTCKYQRFPSRNLIEVEMLNDMI
jgi:hypothetical protein